MIQTVLGISIALIVWAGNLDEAKKPQGTYNDQFLYAKHTSQETKTLSSLNELIWRPVIEKYARQYGASSSAMVAVARCESGFNPLSYNVNDPNGGSRGIYQYQTTTFYNNAWFEKPDIWNAEQQIELTAFLFSKGKAELWACYWKWLGKPVPWLS